MTAERAYRPLAQVRAVGGPYVDQVVADFRALPVDAVKLPRFAEAKALADACETLDWQQLFTLELWVLQLMPLYQLEERATVLGEIFSQPPSPKPKASDTDYELRLRSWAQNLQSERQWVFRKNLLREQEAWRLRRRLGETLLAVTGLGLLLAWTSYLLNFQTGILVVSVAWAGICGGYASIARRSQSSGATRPGEANQGTALGNLCALDVGQDSVVQGMLLGGLFALVGYTLLGSGLVAQVFTPQVANAIFPRFADVGGLNLPLPASATDVAKLAVWSFVFGFTERLVPDVLDKLTGKLNSPAPHSPHPGKTSKP